MAFRRTLVKIRGNYRGRAYSEYETTDGRFSATWFGSSGGRSGWSLVDSKGVHRSVRCDNLEEVREALREFADSPDERHYEEYPEDYEV